MSDPRFFVDAEEFGIWLAAHHASASECIVGFHKRATGLPSMTQNEAVEEALRFGWIDGVGASLGREAFTLRFTPRRARSIWSLRNVAIAERLIADRRMEPAGLAAFAARDPARTGIYPSEQRHDVTLRPAEHDQFTANAAAWAHFSGRPPGYRRAALHWVDAAKRPETRARRLERLIAASALGIDLPAVRPPRRRND